MTTNYKHLLWALMALAVLSTATISIAHSAPRYTSSRFGSYWRNLAPVISGTPATAVAAGSTYSFTPVATDPEGNALTYTIRNRPAWATFSATSGQLRGTPQSANTGTYSNIVISVSDGRRTASLAPFSITVTAPPGTSPTPTNSAPTITGTPPTTARQGAQYVFQPTAADANTDPLTFAIANRPAWATFNVNTGALLGTPGPSAVGTYGNIVISVSDGKASASLPAFGIAVTAANTPPTITGTPPTTATAGTQYAFTPTANDANGDALTFSITNRPAWATFSTSTGRLQGTPTAANTGNFSNIGISVSDGQASTPLPAFTITVGALNTAPTISGTPATSVMQGTQYTFQPTANDADGEALTFSIVNKPVWATFSTSTGRLQGTPGAGNVGTTSGIIIAVSDGKASKALPAFNLAVQATASGSVTLIWQPPTQNEDGSALTNLAGFKVYWGTSLGAYPNSVTLNNPGLASYVVDNLVPGTYFFVMTSVNSAGTESQRSNAASKTIL
jgi:hypothetical protein